MCAHVCVHKCVQVHSYMRACTCGSQSLTLSISHCFPPYFWDRVSQWTQSSLILFCCLESNPRNSYDTTTTKHWDHRPALIPLLGIQTLVFMLARRELGPCPQPYCLTLAFPPRATKCQCDCSCTTLSPAKPCPPVCFLQAALWCPPEVWSYRVFSMAYLAHAILFYVKGYPVHPQRCRLSEWE